MKALLEHLKEQGLSINYSQGTHTTIIGLIGDTSRVDMETLAAADVVDKVQRVSEPYKRGRPFCCDCRALFRRKF